MVVEEQNAFKMPPTDREAFLRDIFSRKKYNSMSVKHSFKKICSIELNGRVELFIFKGSEFCVSKILNPLLSIY